MKKIIPYITNIYSVVLYIDNNNQPCIAYSANNKFSSKVPKQEKLADMRKIHFTDIDKANLYLAKKIYPNIDICGTVENGTVPQDTPHDKGYLQTGSFGGDGRQYYFAGQQNVPNHFLSFYMHSEYKIRREILQKSKLGKTK